MKAIVIQSDTSLIVTVNKDIATVSSQLMVIRDKVTTVQETHLINEFKIQNCQLINTHGKIIQIESDVSIGENMTIKVEAIVMTDTIGNYLHLSNLLLSFEGSKIENESLNQIIKPLIHNYVINNFLKQILVFYVS